MYSTLISNSLEVNTTYLQNLLLRAHSGEIDTKILSSDPEEFNDQVQLAIFDHLVGIWLIQIIEAEKNISIEFDSRFTLI